jgi:hypothetical protein
VWDHVVGSTCIRDKETCGWLRLEERKCCRVRWGVVKEGEDKFWELDCLDPFWIDGDGAAAAGGWIEDAKIWVVGGGRVGDWVFGGGVRGAWVEGNVGFRISNIILVYFAFIFPFEVELVTRIVGIQLSGGCKGYQV